MPLGRWVCFECLMFAVCCHVWLKVASAVAASNYELRSHRKHIGHLFLSRRVSCRAGRTIVSNAGSGENIVAVCVCFVIQRDIRDSYYFKASPTCARPSWTVVLRTPPTSTGLLGSMLCKVTNTWTRLEVLPSGDHQSLSNSQVIQAVVFLQSVSKNVSFRQ
jgi:hypothetical protein